MSVRNSLLALLTEGPKYGWQLRTEFEERTGKTWPLNIGQVYTTLARLDRDGFVTAAAEVADADPSQRHYSLTDAGRTEAMSWFASAVQHESAPRDELAIKMNLALSLPGVDVPGLIQAQRVESMRTLQSYTKLKAAVGPDDRAWEITLDLLIFHTEAEIRWLDHCEQSLRLRPARQNSSTPRGYRAPTTAKSQR